MVSRIFTLPTKLIDFNIMSSLKGAGIIILWKLLWYEGKGTRKTLISLRHIYFYSVALQDLFRRRFNRMIHGCRCTLPVKTGSGSVSVKTFLIHEPLNFHCLCRSCDGSLLYSKTSYWSDNKRTDSFVMEIIRLASFSLLIIYSLRPLLAPFPPPTPTSTAPLPLPLNTRWLFLLLCSH